MTEPSLFKQICKAEENYITEFGKLSELWSKLDEYIAPFLQTNKEYQQVAAEITGKLAALPAAHIVINTLHVANIQTLKLTIKNNMPPLKLECPKCKSLVWDLTALKDFLDPAGKVYERDKP